PVCTRRQGKFGVFSREGPAEGAKCLGVGKPHDCYNRGRRREADTCRPLLSLPVGPAICAAMLGQGPHAAPDAVAPARQRSAYSPSPTISARAWKEDVEGKRRAHGVPSHLVARPTAAVRSKLLQRVGPTRNLAAATTSRPRGFA